MLDSAREIALLLLGIPTFAGLMLVGIGTAAKAWDYCRSCVRRARIRGRQLGWGAADHPNQELDPAEPEAPAIEAARTAADMLPWKAVPAAAPATERTPQPDEPAV